MMRISPTIFCLLPFPSKIFFVPFYVNSLIIFFNFKFFAASELKLPYLFLCIYSTLLKNSMHLGGRVEEGHNKQSICH